MVQSWSFEREPIIRIGRSSHNHVILYSAVVSRHHVEIHRTGQGWVVKSLGTNGTYLNGKRITEVAVEDGMVVRLARSGPNIQINTTEEKVDPLKELLSRKQAEGSVESHSSPPSPLDDLSPQTLLHQATVINA